MAKPDHFKFVPQISTCAGCSRSGYNKEEQRLWCFLHQFPIPRIYESKLKSLYQCTCADADNEREREEDFNI